MVFLSCCLAFTVRPSTSWRQESCRTLTELSASRRELLFQSLACAAAAVLSGYLAAVTPSVASANDSDLFKPNPLTNPFLEQIRIWEQAEADELKYGGELAPGDAGNKGKVEAYPRLLVPISKIPCFRARRAAPFSSQICFQQQGNRCVAEKDKYLLSHLQKQEQYATVSYLSQ